MRAVISRVRNCSLSSEGVPFSHIDDGIMVLFGVKDDDKIEDVENFANKILKLRLFKDENKRLNKSVVDYGGEIMLVSNFTLYGRTKGTNRPDFTHAGRREVALPIYEKMIEVLSKKVPTKTGVFGTHMDITLTADGPTTLIIDSDE